MIFLKNYYKLISERLFFIYIVYTLLFTLVAYSSTLVYTKNDYLRNEQNRLEQLTATFESRLSSNIDMANVLSRHEYVLKYSQAEDGLDPFVIQKAYSEMTPQATLSDTYSRTAIINLPNNHVITKNGGMTYSFFKSSFGLSDTDIDAKLQGLYSTNKSQSILLLAKATGFNPTYKGTFIICLVACPTQQEHPVIHAILYDLEKTFSSIPKGSIPAKTEISLSKDSTYIMYDEADNTVTKFTPQTSLDGYKQVAYYSSDSTYWGSVTGALYVPLIKYLVHINSFILLILLVLTIFAFGGYIFVKTNASKMYSPIRKLTGILPSDFLKANGGDLRAFEEYVTSLEIQKNMMSEIISKTKIELSDKFLIQLMSRTLSRAEIKSSILSYNLSSVKFPLICFIMTYKNYQELRNILSFDGLNEVRTSIHEIMSESFKDKAFFKLIDIDAQTIAAVSSKDNSDFAAELKRAALNVEMMLDIDVVIFMGRPVFSWYEIPDSYSAALQLKNKYIVISDQNIVFSPDADKQKSVEYTSAMESSLIAAVSSADTNAAIEQITEIVNLNMTDSVLTREHFSHFVVMLYSTVIKLLTAINKTEGELFGDMKIYLELISCRDAEELKSKLTYFITIIIQSITSTQKNLADSVANRMISYIENNYANDISLFTLSDYLNVSQSYASKIFKQQTGENFKDYLSNIRLKKALELMQKNPYMKISEIAKSIGYTSATMTRAFTKKYGKSPSDYIKEFQK